MKRLRKHWLTLAGVALVAASLLYAFWPRPVEADLARVTRGALRVTVDEDGKTRVKERYVVSAPLAGRLMRITLRPGDPVKAGRTMLAVLEPTDPALLDERARAEAEARVKAMEAARKQTGARLERARVAEEHAAAELERVRRLLHAHGASQQDYDDALEKERGAQEDLRAAQFATHIADFELDLARAALIRTRPASPGEAADRSFEIRSPVDGRVLRVFQESSAVVTPGFRLLEVGDPDELEVEVDVLSGDAVKIAPGAKVYLEHWGGERPLPGRVRLVEPAGFTKISALGVEEQRVNVIVDFVAPPEKRGGLGDAFRVEARIVTWEADNVLKVAAGALFRQGEDWAVFAVAGGRAELRRVQTGRTNGLETEILSGLGEGDMVVLHPGDRIRAGTRVVSR